MEYIFLIWTLDFYSNFLIINTIVMAITIIALATQLAYMLAVYDAYEEKAKEGCRKSLSNYQNTLKLYKVKALLIVAILLKVFLPAEDTLNMMVGTYIVVENKDTLKKGVQRLGTVGDKLLIKLEKYLDVETAEK